MTLNNIEYISENNFKQPQNIIEINEGIKPYIIDFNITEQFENTCIVVKITENNDIGNTFNIINMSLYETNNITDKCENN